MRSVPTKAPGNTYTATEFNELMSQELQNSVLTSGQTLNPGDLNQLGKAMSVYGSAGDFYTDAGTANTYVLTPIGVPARQAPPAYIDGLRVRFVVGNTNTGASTINLNSLGVKSLKEFGIDIPLDRIKVGSIVEAVFISSTDQFELAGQSASDALPVANIAALIAINTTTFPDKQITNVQGYLTVGDTGGGIFDLDKASSATADGSFIVAPTTGPGRWIRRSDGFTTVAMFGAVGDGVANDTVAIQAAVDHVIANANLSNRLWFNGPAIYLIDNVICNSALLIEFIAYGAYISLNASGSAGITLRGSSHRWRGGTFVSASGLVTHLARAFDFTQAVGFAQNNGSTIEDVDIINVYQGINFFMDTTTFPANSSLRHRVINCFIRNTTNGTRAWAGSFGIKFDGTTTNNSAGNDSKVIGGLIAGFETGLFTNGAQTNTIGLSVDGCREAFLLDGTNYFNQTEGYHEFNDFSFKYVNSPQDTLSTNCSFSAPDVGFSTGTHGTGGNFGKHLFSNCIGIGAIINEFGETNFSTNTGTSLRTNVRGTGEQYQAKNASGTLVFEIDVEGLVAAGNPSAQGVNDFAKVVANNAGNAVCFIRGNTSNAIQFFATTGSLGNAANTAVKIPTDTVTGRSVNAGGTINASGADYAEYMTKTPNCKDIAKGDICGVDDNGQLTDKYDNAHSFVIKSTNPSYVGGDVWDKDENGLDIIRPVEPVFKTPDQGEEEKEEDYLTRINQLKSDFQTSDEYLSYLDDLSVFETALETARQKVDRIAFSGQVPVNMTGAAVADYIFASRTANGGIEPVVGPYTPDTVGKVWTILSDGRPLVKVL